jgi:hypothetical protein
VGAVQMAWQSLSYAFLHERPHLPKQHARFVASHVLCPTVSKMNKKIFAVSEKKKLRHFNRKRKLEAFFNVALANDKQRQVRKEKIWTCTQNSPTKIWLIHIYKLRKEHKHRH